jgi:hypothetical protein
MVDQRGVISESATSRNVRCVALLGRMPRYPLSVLAAGAAFAVALPAAAEQPEATIHVAQPPTLSVGLDGYAGMGVLANGSRADASALGGGMLRLRSSYAQIGGFMEAANLPTDTLQGFGGFMGGWLPFANWLTFDLMLGAGRHTYDNPDRRYGPDGYQVRSWFGTLRLGVSDRTHGILGLHTGAMLFASLDFTPTNIAWRYGLANDPTKQVTGLRRVGGFALGVAVSAGFDVATPSEATMPELGTTWNSTRSPRADSR